MMVCEFGTVAACCLLLSVGFGFKVVNYLCMILKEIKVKFHLENVEIQQNADYSVGLY
jgi:hypothetical protein